ncbi:MAG TPA: YbhB/YbcL family Raf kinase inhibitor-like protein [Patescibacteria group bacterium]|jgi:hypothetical protein|nr:YbhB/YbcL family Raf kinase inhibitor-like protein [Patescibacteria group bacterium]
MERLNLKLIGFIVGAAALALIVASYLIKNDQRVVPKAGNMKITSSAFKDNEIIPKKYTCDGETVNPPLAFENVPSNAKSLVLIMDDLDAPSGIWNHWLVWNIDSAAQAVVEKNVPTGAVEGQTSFGKPGYGGPCPPSGQHRYVFKLFALNNKLNLTSDAGRVEVEQAMTDHVIEKTELVGLYTRSK